MFNLGWSDYGFRSLDLQTVRFISSDPLASKFPELTNYQYASNNPILNIDLDGLEGVSYFKALTDNGTKAGLKKGSEAQNDILSLKVGVAATGVKGKFEVIGQGVDYDSRIANNEVAITTGGQVSYEANGLKASASMGLGTLKLKAEFKGPTIKADTKNGGSVSFIEGGADVSKGITGTTKVKETIKPTFEVESTVFTMDGIGAVTAGIKANISSIQTTLQGYGEAALGFIKSVFTQGTNNTFKTNNSNSKPEQYIKE
jgi:hypothetical protein